MCLPYELRQEFVKGNLVLFVGAGLVKNYFPMMPDWQTLLTAIFQKLDGDPDEIYKYTEQISDRAEKQLVPPELYLRLAQLFENVRERKKQTLLDSIHYYVKDIIEKQYEKGKNSINLDDKYIKKLRDLPLNTWITTNYDCFIEECVFSERDDVCILKRPVTPREFINFDRGKRIFKIHGCVKHAYPEKSIVITEDDYYRFLREDKYLSNKLFTLFCEKTIVFLGYGLRDPNINMVYNDVLYDVKEFSFKESTIRSFSDIRPAFFVSGREIPDAQKIYFSNKRIEYIESMSIEKFFAELTETYEKHKKYEKGVTEKIKNEKHLYYKLFQELKEHVLEPLLTLDDLDKLLTTFELYYVVSVENVSIEKALDMEDISGNDIITILHNIIKTIEVVCNTWASSGKFDILEKLTLYWNSNIKDKKSWYAKALLNIIETVLLQNISKDGIEEYIHNFFDCLYYYDESYRDWDDYEFMLERYISSSPLAVKSSKTKREKFVKQLFQQLRWTGRSIGESWYSVEKYILHGTNLI